MESRFGADFSEVKVHQEPALASEIQAQAFTHGKDIYFNSGKYAPETDSGKALLAHELTHVVQQSSANDLSAVHRQIQKRSELNNPDNLKRIQYIKHLFRVFATDKLRYEYNSQIKFTRDWIRGEGKELIKAEVRSRLSVVGSGAKDVQYLSGLLSYIKDEMSGSKKYKIWLENVVTHYAGIAVKEKLNRIQQGKLSPQETYEQQKQMITGEMLDYDAFSQVYGILMSEVRSLSHFDYWTWQKIQSAPSFAQKIFEKTISSIVTKVTEPMVVSAFGKLFQRTYGSAISFAATFQMIYDEARWNKDAAFRERRIYAYLQNQLAHNLAQGDVKKKAWINKELSAKRLRYLELSQKLHEWTETNMPEFLKEMQQDKIQSQP